MSRRRNASPFRYSSLEDRRLLDGHGGYAGVSVVEETRTLHIRPVVQVGLHGDYVTDIDVDYNAAAQEIFVTEHLSGEEHDHGFQPTAIRTLVFDATTIDNLVYIGTNGPDFFQNNTPLHSFIKGRSGDDFLLSGWGNDKLFGDGGDDWLDGGKGDDRLQGSNGRDIMFGNLGSDILIGDDGNDTLNGGTSANPFVIDPVTQEPDSDDTLYGGAGNDTLRGSDGNDLLYGHSGRDFIQGGNGDDVAVGGDGDDWILEISSVAGFSAYNLDGGNDYINGGEGNDELMGGMGQDRIFGQAGDDLIGNTTWNGTGSPMQPGTIALAGQEIFVPSERGSDFISGGDGNDTIYGGFGDDRIRGGAGDDILYGGVSYSASTLDGQDVIFGGDGNDVIRGGSSADSLWGGFGDDMIYGESGRDYLDGQGGSDMVSGGYGGDFVFGGNDSDTLLGDEGDDQLFGAIRQQNQTQGFDELNGGEGLDRLTIDLGDLVLEGEFDQIIYITR